MIKLYFGVPGCGKTTTSVREIYQMRNLPFLKRTFNLLVDKFKLKLKKFEVNSPYDYYFSNYENRVSRKVSLEGLGLWTFPENSFLSIDESSIEYNNRNFKSLPQHTIAWFKLHRHFKVDVSLFSQGWDDCDKVLRTLVDEVWYVKKVGPFTVLRRIFKNVCIDENTHQIIDGYKFEKLMISLFMKLFKCSNIKIYLRKPYYKYFDTYSRPNLPIKYGGVENA